MQSIQKYIRNFIEYTGTGDWIYTQRVLGWMFDSEIVHQLPLNIRLFCLYVRLYIRIVGTETIVFGHGVYRALRLFGPVALGPTRLNIRGQTAWLDLGDPGALWAIQELSIGSTMTALIQSLVASADVFVDVGANQGVFTTVACRTIRDTATIVAIEPQPELASCIENTLNASNAQHWIVIKKAVAESSQSLNLALSEESSGEAHLLPYGANEAKETLNIEVTTLDDILVDLKSHQNVLVKMDIEGGELAALRGGKDFFSRCAPILIMELNPPAMERYGYDVKAVAQLLTELGYRYWSFIDQTYVKRSLSELPSIYCDIILMNSNRDK